MAYKHSKLDRSNIGWFENDNSCASLHRIRLENGNLRALSPFEISFSYPISAIAGENGTGKSTILAMAACAFHNSSRGYKTNGRKFPYYTFSDFFIQSSEELPPQGVTIRYQIRYNHWRRSEPGLRWQVRRKKINGKWNNYDSSVPRNVIYFGIQRVVPHYERSAHRSYRTLFRQDSTNIEIQKRICAIAGRIIGKNYGEFKLLKHSKYSLPLALSNGVRYSGFNMGAGESAVFDILTALFDAGKHTLLIIDEIELGLHEKAQRIFMEELKKLCDELHCQIICSTHSPIVLDALPPEGRFFIEDGIEHTHITPCISPRFACCKLSGRNAGELNIFVEDDVAKSILQTCLPHTLRSRINIHEIGSSEAVLRQLSAYYLEKRNDCLAILDGDKQSEKESAKGKIAAYTEASTEEAKESVKSWSANRLLYLPDTAWPEKMLINHVQYLYALGGLSSLLESEWGISDAVNILTVLDNGLLAGKHNEFYAIGKHLELEDSVVMNDIVKFIKREDSTFLTSLIKTIADFMEQ